jgi:transcriptional regulator with XRE-family HTH domain
MSESDAYTAERSRLLLAFGEKLRAERERRNVSQDTLAEIADIHRTHLGALELGQREPHLSMLLILADALETRPETLLEGLPVPRERKAPTHSKSRRLAAGEAGAGTRRCVEETVEVTIERRQ